MSTIYYVGHSAFKCFEFTIVSKKIIIKTNSTVDTSTFKNEQPSNIINKIQTNIEPLHINALFNNKITKITIDIGSNVCCIKDNILSKNQRIYPSKIKFIGPNNEPLHCTGTTYINIQLGREFRIYVYVIKNLSSTIILGDDFLIQHKSIIDFNKNNLILESNIKVKLNSHSTNAINFIKESINNSNSNIKEMQDNIFNAPSNYAIAHCISACLNMTKGLSKEICNKFSDTKSQFKHLKPKIGDIIIIHTGVRVIFHLVTKKHFTINQILMT